MQISDVTGLSDAEFSRRFRCPESYQTEAEQKAAVITFINWYAAKHGGNVTIESLTAYRMRLLEEHHCDKTLKNIRSSSSAISESRSPRNLCTGDDGRRYFSKEFSENCVPLPLAQGWKNFGSWPEVVLDILPSKAVKERDGTKIWAQFFLAEAVPSEDGRWSYDHVKSITKFFCGTKQQLLIQATYSLNGRLIYERSSTESVMEEIEPDTLAEKLYEYACKR
jgi:hypothetical protein